MIPRSHTKHRNTRVSHGTTVSLLKSGQREKESPSNEGGWGGRERNNVSELEYSQVSPPRPSCESSIKMKVHEKNVLKLWQWEFEIRAAEFCLPPNNKIIILKRFWKSETDLSSIYEFSSYLADNTERGVKLSAFYQLQATKIYKRVEKQVHWFFTSALHRGEWSASRPDHFTPGEVTLGTRWVTGLVGPTSIKNYFWHLRVSGKLLWLGVLNGIKKKVLCVSQTVRPSVCDVIFATKLFVGFLLHSAWELSTNLV